MIGRDEVEALALGHGRQVGEASAVRQLVENRDRRALQARQAVGQNRSHEVRADEPGAAGDQEPHRPASLAAGRRRPPDPVNRARPGRDW